MNANVFPVVAPLHPEKRPPEIRLRSQARFTELPVFIRVSLFNILQSCEKASLCNMARPHQGISLKPTVVRT